MPSMIELQQVAAFNPAPPTADVKEQNAAAVDPENFTLQTTASGIVFTILGFYVVIYLLHLLDRKLNISG